MAFSMDSDPNAKTFSPKPKSAGRWRLFAMIFLFMAVAGPIAVALDDELDSETLLISLLGIVLFGGLAAVTFRRSRSAAIAYRVDQQGITALKSTPKHILWSEIADVDLVHPLGGLDELSIHLLDPAGKKLLSIATEDLERGGRTFLDELFVRLDPIFRAKAITYLKGGNTWGIPLIKNVVRIEGGILHVEFPKLKKHAIALAQIIRVEWLPGAISGVKKGFVAIEYPGGKIELPQNIKGIQYFVFSLKHMANLGDRINPPYAGELAQDLDKARVKSTGNSLVRIVGLVLMAMSVFKFGPLCMDWLDDRSTESMGHEVQAEIIAKEPPNSFRIQYVDDRDEEHAISVRVMANFYKEHEAGETLSIRLHPVLRERVLFEGRTGFFGNSAFFLFAFLGAVFIVGAILTIWSFVRGRSQAQKIEALEREAMGGGQGAAAGAQAAPSALSPSASAAMPPSSAGAAPSLLGGMPPESDNPYAPQQPGDEPVAEPMVIPDPTPDEAKTCWICDEAIAEDFFMTEGQVWCAQCTSKNKGRSKKPTWGVLFKAAALGGFGGVVGGALWTGTAIMTGYELGIVAILVGLIVGYGIKKGAGDHQGRSLQVMALGITFLTLAYSMIPIMIHAIMTDPELSEQISEAFNEGMERAEYGDDFMSEDEEDELVESLLAQFEAEEAEMDEAAGEEMFEGEDAEIASAVSDKASPFAVDAELPDTPAAEASEEEIQDGEPSESGIPSDQWPDESEYGEYGEYGYGEEAEFITGSLGGDIALAIVALIAVLILGPVVIYFVVLFTSPMSILFLGIALWEAWRINRAEVQEFQGPFRIGAPLDFGKADFADSPPPPPPPAPSAP